MFSLTQLRLLIIGTLMIIAVGVGLFANSRQGVAQTTILQPETAVERAIAYAHTDLPDGGRLVGEPITIHGQIMTYAQAHQLRFGQVISPNEGIWQQRDQQVWVIALRGNVEVANPTHTYRLMIVVIDSQTAELLDVNYYPTEHEVDVSALPALTRPAGLVPTPIVAPEVRPAAIPEPTLTPARAAPVP